MQKQLADANLHCSEMQSRLEHMHSKAANDLQTATLAVHERDRSVVQAHKRQADAAEQEAYALKTQITSENVINTRKIQELQDALDKSRLRNKETATKLHQSVEGLNFDMLAIKRQVTPDPPASTWTRSACLPSWHACHRATRAAASILCTWQPLPGILLRACDPDPPPDAVKSRRACPPPIAQARRQGIRRSRGLAAGLYS